MRFVVAAVLLVGCVGGDPNPMDMPDGGDDAEKPWAKAGADQDVHTTTPVALSGGESSTPRTGAVLTYDWELVMRPASSAASLSSATAKDISFTPDRDGTYVVRLIVDDGTAHSRPDDVTIVASNDGPTAVASADVHVYTGGNVTPTAAASTDPDGDTLTYAWTVTQKPAGSTAPITSPDQAAPTFVPDVDGTYVLTLTVTDPAGAVSTPDHVVVRAWHPVRDLGYVVDDAEHATAGNRLVLLSGSVLHIVDPVANTDAAVALPHPGTAVSVSPDGTHAAVGHDGFVSHVRLSDGVLLATRATAAPFVHDVVLAGNGYAYVFPRTDSMGRIRSLRLSDGVETNATGVPQRTIGKLHPNGTAMYGATNDVIPTDVEKYTLGTGTASKLYDSPYAGDYPMCGDLWISDDGDRLLTRCGRTFFTTSSQLTDLFYAAAIDSAWVRHADHNAFAARWAAIPAAFDSGGNGTVRLYLDDTLAFEKALGPTVFLRGASRPTALVKFVFFSSAGDKLYLVTEAETGGGPNGLVTYVR
jgi:hypothetical protein